MRVLATVLALLGIVGVVFGVLTLMGGMQGPNGLPFMMETSGGPGAIFGGLLLLFGGLYLRSVEVRG